MIRGNGAIGVLLVGHGTRDEVGTTQFLELAETIKKSFNPLAVEAAFLELAQPGIEAGVERLLERGIGQIVTVPLILFAAAHVKRDIPRQVAAAVAARGRTDIKQVQVGHLGCHPAMVDLSRLRVDEAVARVPGSGFSVQADGTGDRTQGTECLLLVARGSSDAQAGEEMREFAALRQRELTGTLVEVAFLAKAPPNLDEQLAKLAATGYKRVIVQPHFLFEGELVERIRGQITGVAAAYPQTEWIVTLPLADLPGKPGLASELLAKVMLDRCREGGIRVVASADDD